MRIVFVLLLVAAIASPAEMDSLGSQLTKLWRLDFAIPDIPAFKTIGTEPGEILRPADVKALALMLGEQTLRNGVLPESYAAEIAPGLLLGSNSLTIDDYRRTPWLYNTRVSVGACRKPDTTGATQVGLGLRTTLFNAGDLKTSRQFDGDVNRILLARNDERNADRDSFLNRAGITDADLDSMPEVEAAVDRYVRERATERANARGNIINALREQYKQRNWNKFSVDLGYASLLESPDSMAKNTRLQRHTVWLTSGIPAGSSGQFLIGGNYSYGIADSAWRHSLSVGARLYGGSNNAKLCAEAGYRMPVGGSSSLIEISGGGEFLLLDGTWVALTLAWEKELGGASRFTPSLEYRFSLPEKFAAF